ncbi:hypothetical protein H0H81_011976 [Sphagnurus paluster]|uniref:ubiquitinyl hydrolase 1 n=1 Tax=Sphagnurus paluster TaxID=117069 RepID=A0A9P7GMY3_9AGAR|nr:hypothetical protein H0H81_011976 [Sphagnurus paluster]
MPGVTVMPSSPGLGAFGSPQPQLGKRMSHNLENGQQTRTIPATLNGSNASGNQYEGLDVARIKEKAIESVTKRTRGISPMTLIKSAKTQYMQGREKQQKGELRVAYASYMTAASLVKLAMESPENSKGSVLSKEIRDFWDIHAVDLGKELKAVEEKLKKLDDMAPPESQDAQKNKSGGSIADRMKALEQNGLILGAHKQKRLSKALNEMTPPSSPKTVSTRLTPPTSTVPLTPSAPAPSSPSPHTLVSPSSFGPDSPPSTPSSSPQLNAYDVAEFTQAFPSIEELDESSALKLPSVPTGEISSLGHNRESVPSSSPSTNNFSSIERASSTPITPMANSFSSRPGSPTKHTLRPSGLSSMHSASPHHVNSKPIIPVSATVTPSELNTYLKLYNVLLIDVRNRMEFERGHIQSAGAIACIEPWALQQKDLTLKRLEEATATLKNDRSVFLNRDKFDLVVIYDNDSETFGPNDSPLAVLNRMIGEQSVQKLLKRQPMLLVGGFNAWNAWLHEFDPSWKPDIHMPSSEPPPSASFPPTSSLNSTNPFVNGTVTLPPTIAAPIPAIPFHRQNISLDQNPVHSRFPAETTYPTNIPSGGLSRKHAIMRPSSSSISYTRNVHRLAFYLYQRIIFHNLRFNTPHSHRVYTLQHPDLASVNPSQRRRMDYIDQSQEAISGLQTHLPTPVNYPPLTPRVPPVALTPTHERIDNRPRSVAFTPLAPPEPKTIGFTYPVTYWFDSQNIVAGLRNIGNTCYMNAPIQCLAATVPLANFFAGGYHYEGERQHDSQEFLSFLLDGIHEDLNRIINKPVQPKMTPEREAELERLPAHIASDQEWSKVRQANDSIVADLFRGQFQNRLQCFKCKKTSTSYNVFNILQVPIAGDGKGKVTLKRCLDEFFAPEDLNNENSWDCPECKKKQMATKTLTLARLPPVLVIHLKRFANIGGKITTFVEFPHELVIDRAYTPPDLHPLNRPGLSTSPEDPRTPIPPYKYKLYGVTNHFGDLGHGHYTAFIASRGTWWRCDDDSIKTVSNSASVVTEAAYVLFYKRMKA